MFTRSRKPVPCEHKIQDRIGDRLEKPLNRLKRSYHGKNENPCMAPQSKNLRCGAMFLQKNRYRRKLWNLGGYSHEGRKIMEDIMRKRPFLTFIGLFLGFLLVYSICSTAIESLGQGKELQYVYLLKRIVQFSFYMIFIWFIHHVGNVRFDYPMRFKLHHFFLSMAVLFSVIIFYENSIQLLIDKYLSVELTLLGIDSSAEEVMFRYPIPLIIQTCITAPIAEEIIVRGYLLKILQRTFTQGAALILSSLFFAVLHFDFANTLFYFLIGMILGTVYIKLRSMLYCILLHLLMNSAAVVSYYTGYENGFRLYALLISAIIGIISILILALKFKDDSHEMPYKFMRIE